MLDRSTTSPEPTVERNPTQKLSSETTLAPQKPPHPELPAQSTPCKKNLSLGSKPTRELFLSLRPPENLGHAVWAKPTLPGSCCFVKHPSCPAQVSLLLGTTPTNPGGILGSWPRTGEDGHRSLAGFQKMRGLRFALISDQPGQRLDRPGPPSVCSST